MVMMDDELERLARKRAGAKMGWYIHATVYVLVNAMLVAMAYSMGRNWAVFPAISWGFGLAVHGVVVFFFSGNAGFYQRVLENERMKLQKDPW